MENRNKGDGEPDWLQYLRPPPQFWNFPRGHAYSAQEPIQSLVVREITTHYDDQELSEIRRIVVSELPVKIPRK